VSFEDETLSILRDLTAVKEWFAVAASGERPPLRDALARAAQSAPTLVPDDDAVISADATYAPFVRTTCVTTMLKGAPAENVLPTSAEAIVNCRIMPDETREQTLAALVGAVGNPKVTVEPLEDFGTGPVSPLDGPILATIKQVAAQSFPNAKIVISMQPSITDSRYLRASGIAAYGLTSTPTSLEEVRKGHGSHGPDERRPTRWLGPGVRYLRDVVVGLSR
jgi:acetylornithine deacetylase/succinyl-diaminopimelate desuccinylase-like protein